MDAYTKESGDVGRMTHRHLSDRVILEALRQIELVCTLRGDQRGRVYFINRETGRLLQVQELSVNSAQ